MAWVCDKTLIGTSFFTTAFESDSTLGAGLDFLGKEPLPNNSQYRSTSGKEVMTLRTNSRLGLFLPAKRWEILDR